MTFRFRHLLLALLLCAPFAHATDVKISALPAASAADGTEVAPVVQSAATKKMTTAQIKTYTSASPTLVTPVLGVATATSVNKVAITAPATSATLTIADGKTLTASNSLSLAGTDSTVMTFPSTSATIARTDAANTFTGTQTFGAVVGTTWNGNTWATGTGTLSIAAGKTLTSSNTLTLAGTDSTTMTFPTTSATLARTDAINTFTGATQKFAMPTNTIIEMDTGVIRAFSNGSFCFSSSNSSATACDVSIYRNGEAGVLAVGTTGFGGSGAINVNGIRGNTTLKTLTETTPTNFVKITMTSGSFASGDIIYAIEANDATDFQIRSGRIPWTAVDKAGTITCTVGTVAASTEVAAVSTGTLTNTFTCADAGSNVLNLLANATSSLTQTTLRIRYRVEELGNTVVTAQ